jgi:XTP/dITP diphosphohydrolase
MTIQGPSHPYRARRLADSGYSRAPDGQRWPAEPAHSPVAHASGVSGTNDAGAERRQGPARRQRPERPPDRDRRRIVVATRSPHKLRELRELLRPRHADLISLDDAGVPSEAEPIEDGATFAANARLKARFYARLTGLPTVADDSGLEVDALGGDPGVRTRRYAGEAASDGDNNRKLLAALSALPPAKRGARYVCVLVLALPERAGPHDGGMIAAQTRGSCRGRIASAPRGTGGFGYDPIFEPAAEPVGGRTLGQWSAAEKNRISHRARAARRMAPILERFGF